MQFSKYLLAFVLSSVLAEASDYYSAGTGEETSKRMVSKASTVVHTHDAPQTTMTSKGHKYGYEDKDYDKTKTTHADTTKTHHDHTKTYSKIMHTDSLHSMHQHKMHYNSTSVANDYMKQLKTYTATSTMASSSYIYESYTIPVYSESSYMTAATTMTESMAVYSEESYMAAATTMTDSTSAEMTFDVFTMSSCTGCIEDVTMTEAFGTGLITASVAAQDFTMSLSDSYVANTAMATAMATPPYYMPSTMVTSVPYMTASAPSAGFASTSLAVFTGSGGRQSVDYLLVAVLPALVGMVIWV